MNLKLEGVARARAAFWIQQAFSLVVAMGSIWFGARVGFEQAVRYERYAELRGARDLFLAVDAELAVNHAALEEALQDWSGAPFHRAHLITHAIERARDSDEYFLLPPSTTRALDDAYAPSLQDAITQVRAQGPGPMTILHAMAYAWHRDHMEVARTALAADLGAMDRELYVYGEPPSVPIAIDYVHGRPPPPLGLAPSPGWKPGTPTGALPEVAWWNLVVPASPAGSTVISYRGDLAEGRTAVRLWVCLLDEAPIPPGSALYQGRDDKALDEVRTCRGGTSLAHPLPPDAPFGTVEGDLVDLRQPIAWRWALVLVEDDLGGLHPTTAPGSARAGSGDAIAFWRAPAPGALVLPADARSPRGAGSGVK